MPAFLIRSATSQSATKLLSWDCMDPIPLKKKLGVEGWSAWNQTCDLMVSSQAYWSLSQWGDLILEYYKDGKLWHLSEKEFCMI